jgi:hypothetical protein
VRSSYFEWRLFSPRRQGTKQDIGAASISECHSASYFYFADPFRSVLLGMGIVNFFLFAPA